MRPLLILALAPAALSQVPPPVQVGTPAPQAVPELVRQMKKQEAEDSIPGLRLRLKAAEKEQARLKAELAKSGKNTIDAVKTIGSDQINIAIDAAQTARKAELERAQAKEVADAANAKAKAAAEVARSQNAQALIAQFGILGALVVSGVITLWTKRADRRAAQQKDERDHRWQVEAKIREESLAAQVKQVHTLVNSNLTAALEESLGYAKTALASLRGTLILLRSSPESDAITVSEINAQVLQTSVKISDLTKILAERAVQTKAAADQLKVDLQRAGPAA